MKILAASARFAIIQPPLPEGLKDVRSRTHVDILWQCEEIIVAGYRPVCFLSNTEVLCERLEPP